jgi:hypothetical protein
MARIAEPFGAVKIRVAFPSLEIDQMSLPEAT